METKISPIQNQPMTEGKVGMKPYLSLIMRFSLFALFGALFVGVFAIAGNDNPLKEAEKWWPFQAFFANIATVVILRSWVKKEGGSYKKLIGIEGFSLKKDLKPIPLFLLVGAILGPLGLFGFSYLILGTAQPPETMFQPLPVWAAVLALILFPLSNAIAETPTYFGYAQPRIQEKFGSVLPAILLTGLALAFQHVSLPLVFDGPYMLWRLVSFVPLALAVAFIFTKTNRLMPYIIVHFLLDFQLVLQMYLNSIK